MGRKEIRWEGKKGKALEKTRVKERRREVENHQRK